ncbi:DNA-binding protein [Candidatus Termititenax persephonae]|uniref:DNA-binding protein n=1 Tax=Candidatus Termititenax persephonae TaxID=2218525 RepID=A0A388TG60_9BACT|nr:DNA-binding protein [Candidatus Termititenax persephonae]
MKKQELLIPAEVIETKIFLIRGKKVMLDKDLAILYRVETKQLKRAVKRNNERFPEDFMFKLTASEFANLRCQNGTSSWGGQRYLPYAFTELGVAMLSSILNSPRAIQVNIQIMRTFTRLREIIFTHKELQRKIEQLVRQQIKQHGTLTQHNKQIAIIFATVKKLIQNNKIIVKQLNYEEVKKKNKQWGFLPPPKNKTE